MLQRCIVACVAAVVACSSAHAVTFRLHNHPDGAAQPPIYGLRLDGLFGAGQTTFSFDTAGGMFLSVIAGEIRIYGTVEVVESPGGANDGRLFSVDMTYRDNINSTSDGGWHVTPGSASNYGTLTAIDDGTVYDLFDAPVTDNSFNFQPNGDRITGDTTTWVGTGWLDVFDDTGAQIAAGATQDWLFTGEIIPLPSAAGLGLAGLAGLSIRRRR